MRLSEGTVPNLRKDDSCDRTLAINHELFISGSNTIASAIVSLYTTVAGGGGVEGEVGGGGGGEKQLAIIGEGFIMMAFWNLFY